MYFKKNKVQSLSFLLILAGLFFFLGHFDVFFSGPQGIHFMRQTDSLSFAAQYFNNGFEFFEPQLFNLNSIEGKSACEFPLMYYISALLYLIFGKNDFVLKLLHYLIVSAGLFYLFKLSFKVLKDYILSILTALFFFTSTVFNFYSFNYLPDSAALGFVLLGIYFMYSYIESPKRFLIFLGSLFFILGSLIKITYLVYPISFMVFTMFLNKMNYENETKKRLRNSILSWGGITLLLVFAWNIFMFSYNDKYESNAFNTTALPIWKTSLKNIIEVLDYMSNYWYSKYFAHSSFHLLYVFILFQVILIKRSFSKIFILGLISLLGSICYLLLFYSQFKDHDYYFLLFLPMIYILLLNGIKTLQGIVRSKKILISIKIIFALIVISGCNYSRLKLLDRRIESIDIFEKTSWIIQRNIKEIDKLAIDSKSKFILAPDECPNAGLLTLNRMGWTLSQNNLNMSQVMKYKKLGAEYILVIKGTNSSLEKELLNDYNLLMNGEDILILSLR